MGFIVIVVIIVFFLIIILIFLLRRQIVNRPGWWGEGECARLRFDLKGVFYVLRIIINIKGKTEIEPLLY